MFDTPQQGYIAVSKYARYLDEKGRRETWPETVQRYFDFAREHVGANYPQALPVWEARESEMFDSTSSLETMPSMRLLMTAGEAVKRNNVAAYNCFAGPTRFMTKDGLRSFSETVGTTQEVLAGDGFWRKAYVRSFGKQKTVKVTLRPGARSRTTLRQTIFVTPDHRWLTGNRGEVTDLRVGDLIPFNDAEAPEFSAQDFVARIGFREDLDFKVISIEDAEEQEVFCVTEPVTGLFTLELGVLTGNCAYTAVSQVSDFSDILLILMHGTGVGFSCERQSIAHLPAVPAHLSHAGTTLMVEDSKEGWADAYFHLLSHLYRGQIPKVDYGQIRPRGARLKVFGGRASGPEPLRRLFDFSVATFREAAGRKLTSIEVHDLVCMIADIVVVGGVRRSALISLSNLSDRRMRDAKAGAWWEKTGHRALANNSAVYTERPDAETFLEEWLALVKSKSGERGIFNRQAAQKQAAKWGRRSADVEYGCNPCSEILLRPRQFCNLTEVVVRASDTLQDLARKVRICTDLGVFQSTLTHFPGISPEYAHNCEEERLLGVSMTGVMDHPVLNTVSAEAIEWLVHLRGVARDQAENTAKLFGVNVSAAITCNKPSGTVAQLTNAGTGGLHPRYSKHYVRTYRQDNKDPLTQFMKDVGVRHEPSFMKPDSETIFSFVVESPEGAVMRHDRTAIEQLEHWLMFQRHWCEHKPSITIYVKDNEWAEVGAWAFKHFDEVCGVSFLPFDNGTYQQAPFQEISAEEFAAWPQFDIDWTMLREGDDLTVSSQELACVGGACSI